MTVPILIACCIVVAGPLVAATVMRFPRWRETPRPAAVAGLAVALLAALSIPWMWDADSGAIEDDGD